MAVQNKYKKNNNDPIIKISVKDEKDKVYLTIWDNGIGIPKNDIKRVFDKSFTGENRYGTLYCQEIMR